MRHALAALLLAACFPAAVLADDIVLGGGFTPDDFQALAEHLGDAIAFPNLGPAEPLGILGFEIYGASGGPEVDTDEHWWEAGVSGDTRLGVLAASRGVARKGLPAKLDLGVQVGDVLGSRFWGGEVRWALVEGSALMPAIGLRAAYSRLQDAPVGLEVAEVQASISKGFAFLTPYGSLGMRRVRADATFGDPAPVRHEVESDQVTGAAGLRITIAVIRLVAEVRQGAERGYFVGIGVGL